MRPKKNMTHEEHLELAKVLRPVQGAMQRAIETTGNKIGKTSRATELLLRMLNTYSEVKSELDKLYHAASTDTQFMEHGHVYYGEKDNK